MSLWNVLTRMWNILLGRTQKALDAVESAEDKARLFISQSEAGMRRMEEALTRALTERKLVANELAAKRAAVAEWEARARMAVSQGRPDLAEQAALQAVETLSQIAPLEERDAQFEGAVTNLRAQWESMRENHEKLVSELRMRMAQYEAARATRMVAAQMRNTHEAGTSDALLAGLSRDVARMEAEAATALEVVRGVATRQDLRSAFDDLEKKRLAREYLGRMGLPHAEANVLLAAGGGSGSPAERPGGSDGAEAPVARSGRSGTEH